MSGLSVTKMSVSILTAASPYNSSVFRSFRFVVHITMLESAPPERRKSPMGEKVAVVVGPS